MFNKKIEMSIKEYFEIVRPIYSVLQIIPDTSNRNYDTELIAKIVSNMYKLPYQKFNKIEKEKGFKFIYELSEKMSFIINITKDDCKFYFIIPKRYGKLLKEKCVEVWKRATVNEIEEFKIDLNSGERFQLHYSKEDALSLAVNKKTNTPLSNILSVKEVMEDGDIVNVLYNFIPVNQRRWKGLYNETLKKLNSGFPIDKEKLAPIVLFKYAAIGSVKIIDFLFDFINDFIGDGKPIKHDEVAISIVDKVSNLSKITSKKEDATIIDTQMLVCSKSKNQVQMKNNAYAVLESYKTLAGDNSLVYKKINKGVKINPYSYRIMGADTNKMSTLECNNLIQIPGRDLLQNLRINTKVDVLESPLPLELQHGYICLGKCVYRGKEYKAYIRDEYNFGNLALLLLSPQGGGKTTFISNIIKNAYDNKECNIVLDFVKNCGLSSTIVKVLGKENVIDIDLSKKENFQGLSFNEVETDSKDEFELLKMANLKAEQTMAFIDSINVDGMPLTSKMRRYLSSAANIVYMKKGTSIGDVIKCLQNYKSRSKYIEFVNSLSKEGQNYFSDLIDTLKELDDIKEEKDSKTKEIISRQVVGTKDTKIDGILDRVNLMKENLYLKYMFSMSCENNINFVKLMEEGKTVLIRMPEDSFSSPLVKNVLVTFFTSKVILATKLRGSLHEKPRRCNVFYDELYQAPTAEYTIRDVLSQLRKFGTKIIISAHYLNQLIPSLKDEIKASGSSYMLLQGADKRIFEELKEELNPYILEDLLNLKQHCSLNLMRYEKGYAKFITHLPGPLIKEG
ncbi:hypothetical protein [Clostridium sp.]|jgi:hypothetical protein|uniref:hypothetical protein n=1 Tax=Clostridium sp. TaxID=1506 RepID=UPI00258D1701|nr:hypothetical protein [Clostridium sp.]MDF2502565.1 hypothetical protein [Clostridium sp.]